MASAHAALAVVAVGASRATPASLDRDGDSLLQEAFITSSCIPADYRILRRSSPQFRRDSRVFWRVSPGLLITSYLEGYACRGHLALEGFFQQTGTWLWGPQNMYVVSSPEYFAMMSLLIKPFSPSQSDLVRKEHARPSRPGIRGLNGVKLIFQDNVIGLDRAVEYRELAAWHLSVSHFPGHGHERGNLLPPPARATISFESLNGSQ